MDIVNEGLSDGVSDGVKEEIAFIVESISKNEDINTITQIGNKLKRTIERYLNLARKSGIIEYKGAAKTGGYFLTEKIKNLYFKN
jgi:ATP-dependent DNA helicase RecG